MKLPLFIYVPKVCALRVKNPAANVSPDAENRFINALISLWIAALFLPSIWKNIISTNSPPNY